MNTAVVCGDPHTGKTSYVERLIAAHRAADRQFLVVAPHGGLTATWQGSLPELVKRGSHPEIARVWGDSEHAMPDARAVCSYALWRGRLTLVVDEFHQWFRRGERISKGHPLWRLLHEGMHARVFVIAMTQNPYDVAYDFTSMVHTCVFFRLSDPAALAWVASKAGRDVAARVRGHQGYEPIRWTASEGLLS